jgi:hypothetical protein
MMVGFCQTTFIKNPHRINDEGVMNKPSIRNILKDGGRIINIQMAISNKTINPPPSYY